jgi:hypothetical protein
MVLEGQYTKVPFTCFSKEVAQRFGQIVVVMYDTAIRFEKIYQNFMAAWTREVFEWSNGTEVLLGLPAHKDGGVSYHIPRVENLKNALLGIHSGLGQYEVLPKNCQGVALYCEWEMDQEKWEILRTWFLNTKSSKQRQVESKSKMK